MIYHIVWGNFHFIDDGVLVPAYYQKYIKTPKVELLDGKRRLYLGEKGEAAAQFLKMLRDPARSDTFLFVLVKRSGHIESFDKFIKEHDLQEYVTYRSPEVTNPIHRGNGRQLQLVVMQTKNHFQKELIK